MSLRKLVCACCFIAAMPWYVRAQGIAPAQLDARQPARREFVGNVSSAQPESGNVLMPIVPSSKNSASQLGDSLSGNQTLPDAPSSLIAHGYVPLADERWRNFWNDTLLSPLSYVGVFGGALGQELAGQPRQWGKSFSGYVKRAGVNLIQFGTQETIHQGGAALMHTDPRYLTCHCSGGIRRSWHALEMSFLTYRGDGSKTVDLPQLAGAYGGAIIAEIPYPSHYSPLVQGVQNGHIQVGANVAINLFREFSPELRRLNPFRHRAAPQ